MSMIDSAAAPGPGSISERSHNGHHPTGVGVGAGGFPHQKMIIHKWGSVSYSSLKSASPPPSSGPTTSPFRHIPSLLTSSSPRPAAPRPGPTPKGSSGGSKGATVPNRHAFVTTSRFDPFSFDEEQSPASSTSPAFGTLVVKKGRSNKKVNMSNGAGHKVTKRASDIVGTSAAPQRKPRSTTLIDRNYQDTRDSSDDTFLVNDNNGTRKDPRHPKAKGKKRGLSIMPSSFHLYPSSESGDEHQPPANKRNCKQALPAPSVPKVPRVPKLRGPASKRRTATKSLNPTRKSSHAKVDSPVNKARDNRDVTNSGYALTRMRSTLPLLIPIPQQPPPPPPPPFEEDESWVRGPSDDEDDMALSDLIAKYPERSSANATLNSSKCSVVLPRIDEVLNEPIDSNIADHVTDLKGIFFGNTYIDLSSHHRTTVGPNPTSPPSTSLNDAAASAVAAGSDAVPPPFRVRHLTGDKVLDYTQALACAPPASPAHALDTTILGDLASTSFLTSKPPKLSPNKKRTARTAPSPVPSSRATRYRLRSTGAATSPNDEPGPSALFDSPPDPASLPKPVIFGTRGRCSKSPLPQSPCTIVQVSPGSAFCDTVVGIDSFPLSPVKSFLPVSGTGTLASPPVNSAAPLVIKERKYFVSKGPPKPKASNINNIFDWTPNVVDKEEEFLPWTFEVRSPSGKTLSKNRTDSDTDSSSTSNNQDPEEPVRVRGVKQAYQCHEYGEVQDINDDVEYLLAGLKVNSSVATKCLSILGMTNKCLSPPFLTYVRSRAIINLIYRALWKTTLDPETTLCAAIFFFVLSFDKKMQADADLFIVDSILRLYNKLVHFKADALANSLDTATKNFLIKNCCKIRSLFTTLLVENGPGAGAVNHLAYLKDALDHELVDPTMALVVPWGQMVLIETLNNFCLVKNPELDTIYLDHVRESGAENVIIDTALDIQECLRNHFESSSGSSTEALTEAKLRQYHLRLIQLIGAVGICTTLNEKNQKHLETYRDGQILNAVIWVLSHSIKMYLKLRQPNLVRDSTVVPFKLPADKDIFVDLITACLKVVMDMTYHNESGCMAINQRIRDNSFFTDMVNLVNCLRLKEVVKKMYDMVVLTLGCLINLTEKCEPNCHIYMRQWQAESLRTEDDSAKRLIKTLFLYLDAAATEYEGDSTTTPGGGGNGEEEPSVSDDPEQDDGKVNINDFLLPSPSTREVPARQQQIGHVVTKVYNETIKACNKLADDIEQCKTAAKGKPFKPAVNCFTMYLQKAGRHMEYSLIASYISLFWGCLIYNNREYTLKLRNLLPPATEPFLPLIHILHKYLKFIKYTSAIGLSSTNYLSIKRILDALEGQQFWE